MTWSCRGRRHEACGLLAASSTGRVSLLLGALESGDCSQGVPLAEQAPNCDEDAAVDGGGVGELEFQD